MQSAILRDLIACFNQILNRRRFLPGLDGVFPHVDGPVDTMELDVEAAGVANGRTRQVPAPEGRLLGVAVGAGGLRTQSGSSVDGPAGDFRLNGGYGGLEEGQV